MAFPFNFRIHCLLPFQFSIWNYQPSLPLVIFMWIFHCTSSSSKYPFLCKVPQKSNSKSYKHILMSYKPVKIRISFNEYIVSVKNLNILCIAICLDFHMLKCTVPNDQKFSVWKCSSHVFMVTWSHSDDSLAVTDAFLGCRTAVISKSRLD